MSASVSPSVAQTWLNQWQTQLTLFIFGFLILIVMVFKPAGLAGIWLASRPPSSGGRTRHEPSTDTPTAGARDRVAPLLAVGNVEVVYGVSLALRGVSFVVPEHGASRCSARTAPARRRRSAPSRACSTSTTASSATARSASTASSTQGDAHEQDRRRGRRAGARGAPASSSELTVEENLRVGASARVKPGTDESLDRRSSTSSRASRSATSSRPAGSRAASSRWSRSAGR